MTGEENKKNKRLLIVVLSVILAFSVLDLAIEVMQHGQSDKDETVESFLETDTEETIVIEE